MTKRYLLPVLAWLLVVSCSRESRPSAPPVPGMVWIPGGEFVMGTDDARAYEHERPAHAVRVDGFWISSTEVTNEQFRKFVDATGYVTVAERKPTWNDLKANLPPGTPEIPDSLLVPGSLVFHRPPAPVTLTDYSQWWMYVPGASWQHPEGPGSNLEGRWNHPVTHVAYDDAMAYCAWEGTRLPTEAEWELAADVERQMQDEHFNPGTRKLANTYQGSFPVTDTKDDGFDGTSPVKTFAANKYGLYDMIGNVWEWTSDNYDFHYFKSFGEGVADNPRGSSQSFDPNEPYARKKVTKGGSYLCASNYCSNYRPTARQGTSTDSGTSNIGFRTVRN